MICVHQFDSMDLINFPKSNWTENLSYGITSHAVLRVHWSFLHVPVADKFMLPLKCVTQYEIMVNFAQGNEGISYI